MLLIARREFMASAGVLAASLLGDAAPVLAQVDTPLFPGVDLNHINIRASNCGRSALFYHGLFGNDLRYVPSVVPNPSTPSSESWFVRLGDQFLSISPVFPHLNLGVDIDHIAPAVRGYKTAEAAAPIVKAHGLETVAGSAGWIRDPDGLIYQLTESEIRLTPPASSQVLLKAGERQPIAFDPLAIRDITLRVSDLNKTGSFFATVFGGEVKSDSASRGRAFQFGGSEIHLIQRAAGPPDVSLDHLTIATREFNVDSAKVALQQRGIQAQEDGRGGVVFADPDGIHVHIARAG